MELEKREELNELYSIYGELLTLKQKEYFESYYCLDLSITEIALNYNISRNGVFDQLKKTETILYNFENVLKINRKNKKIINELKDNKELLERINKIIEE